MTRDERSWTGRTQVGFDILDDKQFNGSLSWQDFNDPLQAGNFNKYPGGIIVNDKTPGFENLSETWTEPSWRIVGSYKFTDKLFGYATISEGYKSGGYNDQTGTSGLMVSELTRPVDPEFATNYEIGMKWESEDGRFRLNPTAFFTTYDDARRQMLIEQAARQRTTMSRAAEPWRNVLTQADKGVAVLRYLRRHPVWFAAGGGLMLAVLGPSRVTCADSGAVGSACKC